MPLKRFICPDNEEVDCKECISEGGCRMDVRCCARPVLKYMFEDQREWKGVPSTTQCLKGTMEAFLEITVDYAQKPDDMAFRFGGSGTHKLLESKGDEISKAELDYSDKSGSIRPDVLENEKGTLVLIDYKNSGSFAIVKALGIYKEDEQVLDEEGNEVRFKSGPRKGNLKTRQVTRQSDDKIEMENWILQLNNYRKGIEKKLKIKVDYMKVQVIVRDGGTAVAVGRGVTRNIYYIDIPRRPDKEITAYFMKKSNALKKAMKNESWSKPCNEEERWESDRKCQNYCPANRACPYYIEKYFKQIEAEESANPEGDDVNTDGCPF